jgi:hypothetical protein
VKPSPVAARLCSTPSTFAFEIFASGREFLQLKMADVNFFKLMREYVTLHH